MADDEDAPWYRPLVAGVGALVGVALLVGAVISLVALGALNVTGLGESEPTTRAEPSLYIPDRTGSPVREQERGLTLHDLNPDRAKRQSEGASQSARPSASAEAQEKKEAEKREAARKKREKEKRERQKRSVISLSASPLSVSSMERIYLTGTYPRAEGASLQVQRLEGGSWRNFPTSTSVSGGTFSTYVMTGQSGPNKFRVVDRGAGKKSNPVTVRVR